MITQFRILSLVAFFFSTAGFAAPAPSHTHIYDDARALLSKTYHLGAVTRTKTGYSHLTVDVFKLRNALQHFTRTLQGSNPSHEHIRNDFARVSKARNHLARVYSRAHRTHHDRHVTRDYRAVDRGYRHLERVVRAHLNRHGHRRGHSQH